MEVVAARNEAGGSLRLRLHVVASRRVVLFVLLVSFLDRLALTKPMLTSLLKRSPLLYYPTCCISFSWLRSRKNAQSKRELQTRRLACSLLLSSRSGSRTGTHQHKRRSQTFHDLCAPSPPMTNPSLFLLFSSAAAPSSPLLSQATRKSPPPPLILITPATPCPDSSLGPLHPPRKAKASSNETNTITEERGVVVAVPRRRASMTALTKFEEKRRALDEGRERKGKEGEGGESWCEFLRGFEDEGGREEG